MNINENLPSAEKEMTKRCKIKRVWQKKEPNKIQSITVSANSQLVITSGKIDIHDTN